MIFGKTNEEKEIIETELAKKLAYGVKKFAWVPTELENGQWIWLQTFYYFRWAFATAHNDWRRNNSLYNNHENYLEWDKKHIGIQPLGFGDKSSARKFFIEQLLHEFGDAGPK